MGASQIGKNLDSPHPLTPSLKDERRGTRIMSPLSHLWATVYTQMIRLPKSPRKPHPVLADIPLLTKERDRFCVAEPG
jgi:hypothetical protein